MQWMRRRHPRRSADLLQIRKHREVYVAHALQLVKVRDHRDEVVEADVVNDFLRVSLGMTVETEHADGHLVPFAA